MILGILFGAALTAVIGYFFTRKRPLKTGEGVFVIPKGVKYVSVSVTGGGGGGSGRNGSSTANLGVNSGDSEMVIKLKY